MVSARDEVPFESRQHHRPRERRYGSRRICAKLREQRGARSHFCRRCDESLLVAKRDQARARSIARVLGCGAFVECDQAKTACKRLERDVTECLGETREQEDIRRCVARGKILAGPNADEKMVRVRALELAPLRPVADPADTKVMCALLWKSRRYASIGFASQPTP